MKVRIAVVCIISICLAGPLFGEERAPLKEKRDKVSYAVGVDIGRLLKKQSVDVNLDVLKEGIRDALTGGKLLLTEDEISETKTAIEKEITEQKQVKGVAVAEKNKREEDKFLAENKNKEGVITLPSGLQYKVIKAGTGKKPKEDDMVSVHYVVSRIDGSEIENSYKKGGPETFVLENVVPGWREGSLLMQSGAKWRLFIPSRLAYGEDGVGELVGPNTLLIFDLELVKVLDPPASEKTGDKTQEANETKGS